MLVNTEGEVGSVSRYTEMGGSRVTKGEVGFDIATMKRASGLFNFGMGTDSTEIFPGCERTMRIYSAISLRTKPWYFSPAPYRVDQDPCLSRMHHIESRASRG